MKIWQTSIEGAVLAEGPSYTDHRGAFSRFFCEQALAGIIGDRHIVQINHSHTCAIGTIRGLHFQHPPHAEMKMVRCIRGRVWDVLVDLRAHSPTFLHWHGEELSADTSRMLVIPEGCAHGFQVLEADSELLYLHTAAYTAASEGAVRYNDPLPGIQWPLPVTHLSERDKNHPLLPNDFAGVNV